MVEEQIQKRVIEDEMKESYLDYSMSVIMGRALPDVRDGLKPVHRRILFAMNDLGMFYNKPTRKCARIVGEVLGKYHPHGDTAVYDSLVRMAQDFSLRYPLVKGQGNFGSIDGDRAAAQRYTEAKLSKISSEMLKDIEKKTVKFIDNFDGSLKEPLVLPSKIPNLLINGSSGIAVGMATNIPPHNITEICKAVIAQIDNPDITYEELMEYVTGPDFPTGGYILGSQGIKQAYAKGRGKIKLRAKTNIEERKNGAKQIIVTEIPYMVNKALLLENIAELVRDKKIEGISDLRDESDRKGMRVVIKLKKDINPELVLNQLYKHTALQTTFGIIMLALHGTQPKVMNLRDVLGYFIKHRKRVVTKRTEFDLKKAEARAHILEGLKIALSQIDAVIKTIKASKNVADAEQALITNFKLSDKQAKAILEMRLQKLTSLETEKIQNEYDGLLVLIKELKEILADEKKVYDIIKKETNEIIETYGDSRRTEILEGIEEEIDVEDLIKEEDVVVTVTHSGYIKQLPLETYKQQARGGVGIKGTETKDDDFVSDIFITHNRNYLLFFSNLGKVYWLKTYQIPTGSRYSKGKAIVNLLRLSEGERITAVLPVKQFSDNQYLFFATKQGKIKKTSLMYFSKPRKGGINAIGLADKDELVQVRLTPGTLNLVLASKKGQAVKFNEADVRVMGRSASGVRGIRLSDKDSVVGLEVALESGALLTVTEKGFGKRTSVSEYRLIKRGGKGVRNIKVSEKNGNVVGIKTVKEDDEIMIITKNGTVIRTPVKNISVIGRNTQGVRVMRLREGDKVVSIARVVFKNGN